MKTLSVVALAVVRQGRATCNKKNRDTFLVIFTDLPAVSMLRYQDVVPAVCLLEGAARLCLPEATLEVFHKGRPSFFRGT